jgi:gamma-glutamylcyclotransferase (GGCT)/AIG2-like uncharacterized protein YtfP
MILRIDAMRHHARPRELRKMHMVWQNEEIGSFFVYGTLQRGEARAKFWPCRPLRIEGAYAFGRLHDLGPYPAMIEGQDRVLGELWTLAAADMPATIQALDAVEGYQQGGQDWYVRRLIVCYTFDGERHEAFSYFWGNGSDIAHTPIVTPEADGYCDCKKFNRRNDQV